MDFRSAPAQKPPGLAERSKTPRTVESLSTSKRQRSSSSNAADSSTLCERPGTSNQSVHTPSCCLSHRHDDLGSPSVMAFTSRADYDFERYLYSSRSRERIVMETPQRVGSYVLGFLGAVAGGALGYYIFMWIVNQGFY